jgi:hypothetical protein
LLAAFVALVDARTVFCAGQLRDVFAGDATMGAGRAYASLEPFAGLGLIGENWILENSGDHGRNSNACELR